MSKKCYRFFGGLLTVQKNWLNKMAEKGYRLIRTGKLLYEFEKCKPGQVQYCVEFIGQKSKANAEDYHISVLLHSIPNPANNIKASAEEMVLREILYI